MTKLPKFVISRDGTETGRVVSAHGSPCQLEGCNGVKYGVRWPDGKLTRICSKGTVTVDADTAKLI